MDEECISLCLVRTFLYVRSFWMRIIIQRIKMFTSYHFGYIIDTNIQSSQPLSFLTLPLSKLGKDSFFSFFQINLFSPSFLQKGNSHPLCLLSSLSHQDTFLFLTHPAFEHPTFSCTFKTVKSSFPPSPQVWIHLCLITSVTLVPHIITYSVKIFIILCMWSFS